MKHILIINQHGENRGDEAAMTAMQRSLSQALGDARFTVLYQHRDATMKPRTVGETNALPIVLPLVEYLRALAYSFCNLLGINTSFPLSNRMKPMIDAYRSADLVVSAPGGPYFGDLYAGHELVHWWYVWLGHRFGCPLFLYAPSAGPFKNRLLNPIRRWMYRKFDTLVVREEISADHLRGLLGDRTRIEVTADSALQVAWTPFQRDDYFDESRAQLRTRFLVAISLIDYSYPGCANRGALRERYLSAALELVLFLSKSRSCHFLLIPQLYGRAHSDVEFLRAFGRRLPSGISFEIVDTLLNSDAQQRIFAMCDLHIASRYHPAIFGHAGLCPGICIYYEHKALGFMQQLGLERFAFDIREVEARNLVEAASELLQRREEIIEVLAQRIPELRQRARRTTELALSLIRARETAEAGAS
jgi:colanic acid/amylovoran biosynthesis protein